MKVFVSWSGSLSRKVAKSTYDWLPTVMQSCEPFLSDDDIRKGDRWASELASSLDETNFGIFIITKSNLHAPWINFEAGALSKSIEHGKVAPLLIDLQKSEVPAGPLNQFQLSDFKKDEVKKLVSSMNSYSQRPVQHQILERTFEGLWPGFEKQVMDAVGNEPSDSPPFDLKQEVSQISFYFREFKEFLDSESVLRKSDFLELYHSISPNNDLQRISRARDIANQINAILYDLKDLKVNFEAEASFENRRALSNFQNKIDEAEILTLKLMGMLEGKRIVAG